jgi:sialic acid synthase SpsE
MKNFGISENSTFIVAEIGNNHEGNFELAKKLIFLASESGADAVKFQTYNPYLYVTSDMKDRINKLKSFQLTYSEFAKLSVYAKKCGVLFFSTPFDLESSNFLNKIQQIFKISSGDNNFFPLIDNISKFGKPIIISTGMSDSKGTRKVYDRILKNWETNKIKSNLYLTHCISSYPVPEKDANLRLISKMKLEYPNAEIGYSDHTDGIEACLTAVSLGSKIIEKHFTIDKKYSDFRDHQLSSDPKEFKHLVKSIRKIENLMGHGEELIQESEKENIIQMRRSIASKKDLPKGHLIEIDDITWVRPGTGIPPGKENLVCGKILNKNILKGQLIKKNFLEKK